MEIDLTPKSSKPVYGGEGGSYFSWSPSDLPMLKEGNIGASKIALQKNGLAMPSYSDSAKVAYVLQGSEGEVIAVKEGDAIALPFGVVTWWFNKEDTELVILFMGDTSKGHKAGEFTEFALTGANGIFTGFTTEFVARALDLEEEKVKEPFGSQKSTGIIKVKDGFKMPEPNEEDRKGMALNCLEAPLDVDIKKGGQVGLGADLVRIDVGSMCSPGFSCDSAYQVTYIIVGVDGKCKLETRVEVGNLFIVPRFFVVSKIADEEGMDWFSIINTPNPIFCHLAGRTSVWKALNPQVLEASFNVAPEAEKHFRSKRTNAEIFFPAPN
ncbi:hypothetical protein MKW98_006462 [Papaver atlanticum]|uniref:Cupin type-1 domain-containing protein n=1 Tax=Papaver atlanticum TaxID=357466 RepID=A0AAD4SH88_9MAGN|nr:hypothetical protein MKW98_006462 [Papaver atlanticum]